MDNIGGTQYVTGINKLIQDVLKILFTTLDKFYLSYGTQIQTLIGKNLNKTTVIHTLGKEISNALAFLQSLQSQQMKFQSIAADEFIQNIQTLQIDNLADLTGDMNDSTSYKVNISILTGSNQTVNIPSVVNLTPYTNLLGSA